MQFVQNPQVQGLYVNFTLRNDYGILLFRMANLVTNLGAQEGGEVGLETLLQTYDD